MASNPDHPSTLQNDGFQLSVSEELATESTKKQRVLEHVFSEFSFDQLFVEFPDEIFNRPSYTQKTRPMILHIDDDADLVDALSLRLEDAGFDVTSALDGISGVEAALLMPADCIVLDYDMPNGRGDQVISLLKKNERTANIPIIVLTAIHKKSVRRKMLSMGANEFMTKPFHFNELKEVITHYLEPGANQHSD